MKPINLVSSIVESVSVERYDGFDKITVVGVGIDADGNEFPVKNIFLELDRLPQNVQNTALNFLKHVSREFNKAAANEDVETW